MFLEIRPAAGAKCVIAVALMAALAVGCGQTKAPIATTHATAAPTPTPSPKRDAVSALPAAVMDYATLLAQTGRMLRTAYARGDFSTVHGYGLALLQEVTAFNSEVKVYAYPDAARSDVDALINADTRLEAVADAILEAASVSDYRSAYAQIAAAERAQQAGLKKLATDLGITSLPTLPAITT